MKKFKRVIPIIIAFIIGISMTVGAATIFNSKDITYSSSATTKKNVKDSLDELYTKVNTPWSCASGWYCYTTPKTISSVSIGDYISMTPTSTSFTIYHYETAYPDNQTINPSELKLWRVIKKNSDGTVDVVSAYTSSTRIYFRGEYSYSALVKNLNKLAAQYTNAKYVSKTRYMGYSNQIEECESVSTTKCPNDDGYINDVNLVKETIGLYTSSMDGLPAAYWIASRSIGDGYGARFINNQGFIGVLQLDNGNLESNYSSASAHANSLRPILTLKADVEIKSGDGKSASNAYQLN